jgi:hypothetical protein
MVGMQTSTAIVEKCMEVPEKLKIKLPYDKAILLLCKYPKEMKSE